MTYTYDELRAIEKQTGLHFVAWLNVAGMLVPVFTKAPAAAVDLDELKARLG